MLLAPLRYWRVRHPLKRRWDIWFPAVGSLLLTGVLCFWPSVPSVLGATGYVAGLQTMYAILGGFFIAALTLLATAQTYSLSQPLSGFPATTYGDETAPLTRQRFLCLLFGYLAFSVFSLYVIGLATSVLAPGLRSLIEPEYRRLAVGLFLAVYNFWLCHTAIATMVGLYYFTDRLQRDDPTFGDPHATAAE